MPDDAQRPPMSAGERDTLSEQADITRRAVRQSEVELVRLNTVLGQLLEAHPEGGLDAAIEPTAQALIKAIGAGKAFGPALEAVRQAIDRAAQREAELRPQAEAARQQTFPFGEGDPEPAHCPDPGCYGVGKVGACAHSPGSGVAEAPAGAEAEAPEAPAVETAAAQEAARERAVWTRLIAEGQARAVPPRPAPADWQYNAGALSLGAGERHIGWLEYGRLGRRYVVVYRGVLDGQGVIVGEARTAEGAGALASDLRERILAGEAPLPSLTPADDSFDHDHHAGTCVPECRLCREAQQIADDVGAEVQA